LKKVELETWYHELKPIEYLGSYYDKHNNKKGSKFLCICKCGNEGAYRGVALLNGQSKRCKNCAAKNRLKIVININDIFDDLRVINLEFITKEWDTTKRKYYKCVCKCGDENYYEAGKLCRGKSKMCKNCADRNRHQSTYSYSSLERQFNLSLKSTGKYISLTLEEFANIIKQNCHYCNEPPRLIKYLAKNKICYRENLIANGIDRVDSSIGYIKENCVPCCKKCNTAKNNLTLNEFKDHITKIYNYTCKKQEDTLTEK
jgi:hypothetical protein